MTYLVSPNCAIFLLISGMIFLDFNSSTRDILSPKNSELRYLKNLRLQFSAYNIYCITFGVRFMGRRVPVYKKIKDVYVKVEEVDESSFDWLIDEDEMEIVAVYIDELEEDYPDEEERIYEYHAEL
ncbi:hypothetical protein Igag_1958 [Ignisphaera aggregans DSM 17230]|uniref:Transmembrane protein n=1 Tax=Ignisphaera aggregans (strain DSM 17230 / JCM 13409 / AQ1.S1) TaxID=583356 RepID=E0STG4_IGNAA|nr:hypothetical protein Igag_1958 [Ignisphaera aggregans DSM 17230]